MPKNSLILCIACYTALCHDLGRGRSAWYESVRGSRHVHGPARAVSSPSVASHVVRRAKALRQSTLERRYDFHLGEAIRATLQGSHDKAAGHSGQALLISRELYADTADPARHKPELAAALCAHARYGGGAWQAIAMLAESAGHYAALAEDDPAAYEVPRIDVLTRIALASDAAGSTPDAISLLREVVGMYLKAPAADQEERDLGAGAGALSPRRAACSRPGWTRTGWRRPRPGLSSRPTCLTGWRIRFADTGLARRGAPLPATGRAGLGGRRGQVNDRCTRRRAAGSRPRLRPGRPSACPAAWRALGGDDAPRRAREDQRQGGGDPRNEKRGRPTWNTHPFGMNPSILMASAVKSRA